MPSLCNDVHLDAAKLKQRTDYFDACLFHPVKALTHYSFLHVTFGYNLWTLLPVHETQNKGPGYWPIAVLQWSISFLELQALCSFFDQVHFHFFFQVVLRGTDFWKQYYIFYYFFYNYQHISSWITQQGKRRKKNSITFCKHWELLVPET